MHAKRIYVDKRMVSIPSGGLPLAFPGRETTVGNVDIRTRHARARVSNQPIPIKDFINFKKMSGNEILLNLDNNENLAHSELISGLIELGKRDKKSEHDWNQHPITTKCIKDLKSRIPVLNAKNVLQCSIVLDNLRVIDSEAWQLTSEHILRLLHKYKGRDMAQLLHLFDKEILDDEGEPFVYM